MAEQRLGVCGIEVMKFSNPVVASPSPLIPLRGSLALCFGRSRDKICIRPNANMPQFASLMALPSIADLDRVDAAEMIRPQRDVGNIRVNLANETAAVVKVAPID